jgi:hypothetical protein
MLRQEEEVQWASQCHPCSRQAPLHPGLSKLHRWADVIEIIVKSNVKSEINGARLFSIRRVGHHKQGKSKLWEGNDKSQKAVSDINETNNSNTKTNKEMSIDVTAPRSHCKVIEDARNFVTSRTSFRAYARPTYHHTHRNQGQSQIRELEGTTNVERPSATFMRKTTTPTVSNNDKQ